MTVCFGRFDSEISDLKKSILFSTVEASESLCKSPVKAVAPLKRGLSSPDALNGDVSSAQSIPPPKVTSTPNFNQGDQIISHLQNILKWFPN